MTQLEKQSISELQDILHNINNWDVIALRIHDIYNSVDVMKGKMKVNNIEARIKTLENMCNNLENDVTSYFKKYGIYVEANMDEMEEMIIKILKKKLVCSLRQEMIFNEDAYNNMGAYVDKYFEYYGPTRGTFNIIEEAKHWIEYFQKSSAK